MVSRVVLVGFAMVLLLTAVAWTDDQLMLTQTAQGPTFGKVSGTSFVTRDGKRIPLSSLPSPVPVSGTCASPDVLSSSGPKAVFSP